MADYTLPLKAIDESVLFYERVLESDLSAMDYWTKKRGFAKETIKHFHLGRSPDGRRILCNALAREGFTQENLRQAGLIKVTDHPDQNNLEFGKEVIDLFRNRYMIPYFENLSGKDQAIGFSARDATESNSTAKYINSPASDFFNKSVFLFNWAEARKAAYQSGKLVIFEAPLSVMSAWQQGYAWTTALSGTALTERHMEKIRKALPDAEIYLFFDGDDAGLRATTSALEKFLGEGLKVCNYATPKSETGETIKKIDSQDMMKAGNKLVDLIRYGSSTGLEFLVNKHEEDFEILPSTKSPEDIQRILQVMTPAFVNISYEKRGIYVDGLSKLLSIPENAIYDFIFGREGSTINPSERMPSGGLSYKTWQNQLIRLLIAVKERDPSKSISALIRHCDSFGGEKLITAPEPKAVYRCLKASEDTLFSNSEPKGPFVVPNLTILQPYTPEVQLEEGEIKSLFDVSQIAHPIGKGKHSGQITQKHFDDALFELMFRKIVAELRQGYIKRDITLPEIREILEKKFDSSVEAHGS